MDKLQAQMIFEMAQTLLRDKTYSEAAYICNGLYDNHPIDVAGLLISHQPVRISIGDDKVLYMILKEDMRIILRKEEQIQMIGSRAIDIQDFLNKLIIDCQIDADSPRKSAGKILALPEEHIKMLLKEFDRKPDSRFGDNLIYGVDIVKRMRKDWNYSALFHD